MASTKSTAWVAGAVVVALGIAAGAWLLAINPTLTDAADQRQAAADQLDHNAMLDIQIAKLKAQFAHIDDYRAELADIQTRVPGVGDLAELTRELQSVADASGVTLSVDSPGTPAAFTAPVKAPATPSPTPSASGDAASVTDDTGSSTSATPAQTGGVDGLFEIPLSLTSIGTYDQTVSFLDALQQAMPRLYVVNQLNATSLDANGAQGGLPAVSAGDLQTVISGYVLTLQNETSSSSPASGASDEPTPAPTQLPAPNGQKNPFQPMGG